MNYQNLTRDELMREIEARDRQAEAATVSLQAFADASADLMMAIDAEGNLLHVNRTLARRYNKDQQELVGTNAWSLIAPELTESRQKHVAMVHKTGQPVRFEDFSRGTWLDNLVFPIFDEQGGVKAFGIVARDITAQRLQEQKLRDLQTEQRLIIDHIPTLIAFVDKQKRYRFANKAYCDLFKTTPDAIVGKTLEEVMGKYLCDMLAPKIEKTLMGQIVEFETTPMLPDKMFRQFHALYIPFKKDRFTDGFFAFVNDITEQKKKEKEMRQLEKMEAIGQLAGGIAHDFNNQLAGILGYNDLLLRFLENEKLVKYAKNVRVAAERAADLTAKLLAFARKGNDTFAAVDFHAIVAEVANVTERIADKRIEITQELSAKHSIVLGDSSQLQNAVLNMAINAIDAMPEGGRLTFKTDVVAITEGVTTEKTIIPIPPGQYFKIALTDTGIGIDPEIQGRIFEPFFTTKPVDKGTGMGLASVFGTVERHKGSLSVFSQVGMGSTFTLYLPLANKSLISKSSEIQRDILTGSEHILFVDDEKVVREMGADMLAELGYQVDVKKDGAEAVAFYKKSWRDIHLVILDMTMPVMNGREVFKKMKAINPDVKVIISSGYDISKESQRLASEGVQAFISKPYDTGQISAKIRNVLDKKK
ncbi:MAG: PAS domain-containing protein [Deltaproteobacteria bacterium]|nr:PAS domain-containing protein [Deltaproteobacteria bacterium]